MLLGASDATTIRKQMIDGDMHANDPDLLMSRMLTAPVSTSFMIAVVNFFTLSISTTYHTIIGSVAGFSITAKGFKFVIW
jgi:phosphate/sulfate permease